MLYQIIIGPIETLIDWIFNFIIQKIPQSGILGAIFGVSITINLLALPLYNVADSIQNNEREITKKMSSQLKRIKATFKGDERFMMIQAFYKENNYHPFYVFRNSLSILIEIPFFIAAYHYLSNSEILSGKGFWIFNNLSQPDLIISGLPYIHILPIIMTIINLVSAFFYKDKESNTRENIQTTILPFIFLVLLYNSPSGLVIYWILNNLFSLLKNIIQKSIKAKKITYFFILTIISILSILLIFHYTSIKKKIFFSTIFFITISFPKTYEILKKYFSNQKFSFTTNQSRFMVILTGISLFLLEGCILSSMAIASSPAEFSYLGKTACPLNYVLSNSLYFFGLYVFWPLCIFTLIKNSRKILPCLLYFLLFVVLMNSFIFKNNYGTISRTFTIDNIEYFEKLNITLKLIPYITSFSLIIILCKLSKHNIFYKLVKNFCYIFIFSGTIFFSTKLYFIFKTYKNIEVPLSYAYTNNLQKKSTSYQSEVFPIIHLSKTGKNVVVFFLDRGQGEFFPSVMDALPKIKEQFSGFTYYPNTVSFSSFTAPASSSLVGGYEYTQEEMNKRPDEWLKDKHSEALKVAPKLFSDANYSVTVIDPPYPNYESKGANYIYDSINDVKTYEIQGKYSEKYIKEVAKDLAFSNIDEIIRKEIKNFTILQSIFPNMRNFFYKYFRNQNAYEFYPDDFLKSFPSIYYLNKLTDFNSSTNNYIFLDNEVTHSPVFLDVNYEKPVSRRSYSSSYNSNEDQLQMHFQVNCAAYKAIGKWIDYLKENNCYDNTRIIIVADHGGLINCVSFRNLSIGGYLASCLNPILLYKDFNKSGEININNTFMTNADTLFLSINDLDIPRINPYTGKELLQKKENGVKLHIPTSEEWAAQSLLKLKTFSLPDSHGVFVKGNIFEEGSWEKLSNKNTNE